MGESIISERKGPELKWKERELSDGVREEKITG